MTRDQALANLGRIVCAGLARERGGQWSVLPVSAGTVGSSQVNPDDQQEARDG